MGDDFGSKVLQYAKKKRGTIVRRKGRPKNQEPQCWDLPEEALARAGAKTSFNYFEDQRSSGAAGKNDFSKTEYDYVWGDPVDTSSIQAGDIIQFRSHKQEFEIDWTITTKSDTFTCMDDIREQTRGPQHSAIVVKHYGRGWVKVMEQHVKRAAPAKSNVVDYGEVFLKTGKIDFTENGTISAKWAQILKRRMSSSKCKKLISRIAKTQKGAVKVKCAVNVRKQTGTAIVYRPQKP
jgi:hypothetical protein